MRCGLFYVCQKRQPFDILFQVLTTFFEKKAAQKIFLLKRQVEADPLTRFCQHLYFDMMLIGNAFCNGKT